MGMEEILERKRKNQSELDRLYSDLNNSGQAAINPLNWVRAYPWPAICAALLAGGKLGAELVDHRDCDASDLVSQPADASNYKKRRIASKPLSRALARSGISALRLMEEAGFLWMRAALMPSSPRATLGRKLSKPMKSVEAPVEIEQLEPTTPNRH